MEENIFNNTEKNYEVKFENTFQYKTGNDENEINKLKKCKGHYESLEKNGIGHSINDSCECNEISVPSPQPLSINQFDISLFIIAIIIILIKTKNIIKQYDNKRVCS